MPIMLHYADLPTPDMAWLFTPTSLVLIADRRVPRDLVVQAISLALSWIDAKTCDHPPRPAAA